MVEVFLRVGVLLLGILLLAGAFIGFEHYREKRLQEQSYREYEIRKLLQAGNYEKVLELTRNFPSGSFKPLALSYELMLAQESMGKVDEGKVLKEIIDGLKDDSLKSLYLERYAYHLLSQGKTREALKVLEGIKKEDFNYASALLLKGQILQKEGKVQEARALYLEVQKLQEDRYMANLAEALALGIGR
ncbi:MAG: hypothetical protein D6674_02125 [Acidobacteria bacterium]|jgi:predicted negative regulator of RcsB-dependent stress response|nr:MAG: hypothetical protein D6674_02125 [Acidobacteriota bacterium]